MGSSASAELPPWDEVIRKLGQGGMGAVFEVEAAGRRLALKTLTSLTPEAQLRFLREAELHAAVSHPHIVRFEAIGHTQGHPFLLLELVEGPDLAQRLRDEGALPIDDAVTIAACIADAVAALHARGIAHRDLKAANILLAGPLHPKLMDFGLARSSGSETLTLTGVQLGTPYAMAPEQVAGEATELAVDSWALGVLLCELLTAQRPFAGTGAELAGNILKGRVAPLPPNLPPSLRDLIQRCLTLDPSARPSAAEVAQELRSNGHHQPATPRRTLSLKLVAAALLGLLIAGLGAVVVTQRQRAEAARIEVTRQVVAASKAAWPDAARGSLIVALREACPELRTLPEARERPALSRAREDLQRFAETFGPETPTYQRVARDPELTSLRLLAGLLGITELPAEASGRQLHGALELVRARAFAEALEALGKLRGEEALSPLNLDLAYAILLAQLGRFEASASLLEETSLLAEGDLRPFRAWVYQQAAFEQTAVETYKRPWERLIQACRDDGEVPWLELRAAMEERLAGLELEEATRTFEGWWALRRSWPELGLPRATPPVYARVGEALFQARSGDSFDASQATPADEAARADLRRAQLLSILSAPREEALARLAKPSMILLYYVQWATDLQGLPEEALHDELELLLLLWRHGYDLGTDDALKAFAARGAFERARRFPRTEDERLIIDLLEAYARRFKLTPETPSVELFPPILRFISAADARPGWEATGGRARLLRLHAFTRLSPRGDPARVERNAAQAGIPTGEAFDLWMTEECERGLAANTERPAEPMIYAFWTTWRVSRAPDRLSRLRQWIRAGIALSLETLKSETVTVNVVNSTLLSAYEHCVCYRTLIEEARGTPQVREVALAALEDIDRVFEREDRIYHGIDEEDHDFRFDAQVLAATVSLRPDTEPEVAARIERSLGYLERLREILAKGGRVSAEAPFLSRFQNVAARIRELVSQHREDPAVRALKNPKARLKFLEERLDKAVKGAE